MATLDLPQPDFAKNMKIIGHTDQGGRPDGVQLMVHNGYAYIGHMFSKGFSVIDVRDPKNPRPVKYMPAPPNTWNIHLQTHDEPAFGDQRQGHVRGAGVPGRARLLQGSLGRESRYRRRTRRGEARLDGRHGRL